jgi:hypothetical protein
MRTTSDNAPTKEISDVCLSPQNGGGFFEGVRGLVKCPLTLRDPPPPWHSRMAPCRYRLTAVSSSIEPESLVGPSSPP